MGLLNKFFKEKNKEQYVNRKYYKNYAEKVYVSEERDLKQWESMISMFPNMLVQKDKMVRDTPILCCQHYGWELIVDCRGQRGGRRG